MISLLRNYLKNKFRKNSFGNQIPEMIYGLHHRNRFLLNTRFGNTSTIISSENLDIDDNVYIGHYNFIEASNSIRIEEGVQITNYVSVLTHSSHVSVRLYGSEYRKTKNPVGYKKGAVSIGKYTFVGPYTTIMPGTNIGKGCLISAYSFLKGDYPEFSVIAGNPAQIVGDTREIDKKYLDEHPELTEIYKSWSEQ